MQTQRMELFTEVLFSGLIAEDRILYQYGLLWSLKETHTITNHFYRTWKRVNFIFCISNSFLSNEKKIYLLMQSVKEVY